jgi:hypothetical protein
MKKSNLIATALTLVALTAPAIAQDQYQGQGRYQGQDQYQGQDHRGDRGGYNGPPRATFYVDDDFRGASVTLDRPVRKLGRIGMEDKISSITVESGAWLVCVDDDFRGRCEVIDHTIGKLTRLGLDDKISSVRPVPPRGRRR